MENNEKYYHLIQPYIEREKSTCSYCDRLDPLILYYGDDFYITNVIGAYMPGYVQLCSYEHRTSITGILPTEYEEFEYLLSCIRKAFKQVYGTGGICFEHGQAGSCMYTENHINSLCHHMHVHCLPVEIDIHQDIVSIAKEYTEVKNINDMVHYRNEILRGGAYLYFSPTQDTAFMYNVLNESVPRQFLRKCVARKLNIIEKADWIKYPGVEYYAQTILDLKSILEEIIRSGLN